MSGTSIIAQISMSLKPIHKWCNVSIQSNSVALIAGSHLGLQLLYIQNISRGVYFRE